MPPLVADSSAARGPLPWTGPYGEAREQTLAEVQAILEGALREVEGVARSTDRILGPLPVTTPAQEADLRRFLAASHLARARAVGTRVEDGARLDSLLAEGALVELEDSTEHFIVRPRVAPAYVVPEMRALLHTLGRRFQARLAELGVPPYRIEVTSALRTSEHQARLRRTNPNAAAGLSSHEFGATVDLSYAAFAPPAERPVAFPDPGVDPFRPFLDRYTELALESVSARKSRELGRIFSEVLQEVQAEGLAVVIYERQQTVYHVTVVGV
ncbi:MAG: DUF5715 family protein, partial [Gemmatimonadota bacterium]